MNLLDHLLICIASLANAYPMKLSCQIIDVLTLYSWSIFCWITFSIFTMAILAILCIELLAVIQVKTRAGTVVGIHR